MKKINLLLILTIFVSITFISSCKKDKEPVATTPLMPASVAKVELRKTNEQVSNMIEMIKEGKASKAFNDFAGAVKFKIFSKDSSSSYWYDDMINKLKIAINFNAISNEIIDGPRINFANHTGKFSWNNTTKTWAKLPSSSIIIEFPAKSTATVNNASFNFNSYTDNIITIEDKDTWIPKSFDINLKLDNVTLASFILKDFSFRKIGNEYAPTALSFETFVDPVRETFNYAEKSNTNYYLSSITDIGAFSFGFSINLITKNTIFATNFDDKDLVSLNGAVNLNTLKIQYAVNLANVVNYTDVPTETQINSDFDIDIYSGDSYVGQFKLQNGQIIVVYTDGSQELAEVVFEGLIKISGDFPVKSTLLKNKKVIEVIKFFAKTKQQIVAAK